MHDGVLKACMALSALAGSANEVGGGLLGFDSGTRAIDEEGCKDERERRDERDKYRAERHA
jgi:hypothetical protein